MDRTLLRSNKDEYNEKLTTNFKKEPGEGNEVIKTANTRITRIIQETAIEVTKDKGRKQEKLYHGKSMICLRNRET